MKTTQLHLKPVIAAITLLTLFQSSGLQADTGRIESRSLQNAKQDKQSVGRDAFFDETFSRVSEKSFAVTSALPLDVVIESTSEVKITEHNEACILIRYTQSVQASTRSRANTIFDSGSFRLTETPTGQQLEFGYPANQLSPTLITRMEIALPSGYKPAASSREGVLTFVPAQSI